MILLAVALLLSATPPHRAHQEDRATRAGKRAGVIPRQQEFFLFAPVGKRSVKDGHGLGAACACSAVTGTRGEAITFSRASTAFCVKGNESSGIANGDLVECASGKPRVMPGGDGTGGLGLAIWEARTNVALRSHEFDNAAWVKYSSGVPAVPVVTADLAVAPDGTTTADRIRFGANTGAADSYIYQSVGGAATRSTSIYVRSCLSLADAGCVTEALTSAGDGGSLFGDGGVALGADGGTGLMTTDLCWYTGTWSCQVCTAVASSWTRCRKENYSSPVGGYWGVLGNAGNLNGGVSRDVAELLVWGGQYETGATVSPTIITTGAASATRVQEYAEVDLGASAPAANSFSAAATRQSTTPDSVGPTNFTYMVSSAVSFTDVSFAGWAMRENPSTQPLATAFNDATTAFSTSAATGATSNTAGVRWSMWSNGTTNSIYNGTTLTPSASQTGAYSAARYLEIGTLARTSVGSHTNGVLKNICIDSSPTRCR